MLFYGRQEEEDLSFGGRVNLAFVISMESNKCRLESCSELLIKVPWVENRLRPQSESHQHQPN